MVIYSYTPSPFFQFWVEFNNNVMPALSLLSFSIGWEVGWGVEGGRCMFRGWYHRALMYHCHYISFLIKYSNYCILITKVLLYLPLLDWALYRKGGGIFLKCFSQSQIFSMSVLINSILVHAWCMQKQLQHRLLGLDYGLSKFMCKLNF